MYCLTWSLHFRLRKEEEKLYWHKHKMFPKQLFEKDNLLSTRSCDTIPWQRKKGLKWHIINCPPAWIRFFHQDTQQKKIPIADNYIFWGLDAKDHTDILSTSLGIKQEIFNLTMTCCIYIFWNLLTNWNFYSYKVPLLKTDIQFLNHRGGESFSKFRLTLCNKQHR